MVIQTICVHFLKMRVVERGDGGQGILRIPKIQYRREASMIDFSV